VRLLLDTHSVIWLYLDGPQLSVRARDSIRRADEVFVSVASGWEYGILRQKQPSTFAVEFNEMCKTMPVSGLGLDFEIHSYSERLPRIHRDPFDRMLVAQALHNELTLVTKDAEICRYPVPTLW
jgi:PIN domain nuclease of toxin-antitoxin system